MTRHPSTRAASARHDRMLAKARELRRGTALAPSAALLPELLLTERA